MLFRTETNQQRYALFVTTSHFSLSLSLSLSIGRRVPVSPVAVAIGSPLLLALPFGAMSSYWPVRCRPVRHRCRRYELLLAGALPSGALPSLSAPIGWCVAVRCVTVAVAMSCYWLARSRRYELLLTGALPSGALPSLSAPIGWCVAVRCVTVAVAVAMNSYWLARCRPVRHPCSRYELLLAGALPSGALTSLSAPIGWSVAVRCVTVAVAVAMNSYWLARSRPVLHRLPCSITTFSRTPTLTWPQGNRHNRPYAPDHPRTPAKKRNLDKTMQSR